MRYNLVSYSILEQGERENQEDSLYSWENGNPSVPGLYMIADGMGGLDSGEIASSAVVESFSRSMENLRPDDVLTSREFMVYMAQAYRDLDNAAPADSQMGTTLALVKFHKNGCLVAHIGDSRVYHIRCEAGSGRILYRTKDHNVVSTLLDRGEITEAEAQNHPQRNVLIRAMQAFNRQRGEVETYEISDIRKGDYFFICSDGMLEHLADGMLMDILSSASTDREKRNLLLSLAKNSRDNYSAIIIHVTECPDESQMAEKKMERRNVFWLALSLFIFIAAVLAILSYYFVVLNR